jgi:alpha/beta superfamily hydrolase
MTARRIDIASAGFRLEGIALGSEPPSAVIAPPHPLYGGHLTNPVVQAIGRGLTSRGVGAVAFNWRGVGLSEGSPSGDAAAAGEDFRAALACVGATVDVARRSRGLIAAGYSFGAATALAVALDDERVAEVIAVAPPVAMLPRDLAETLGSKRVLVVAAEHDDFGPPTRLAEVFARMKTAKVVTIAGADHFFSSGDFDAIADAVEHPA